MRWEGGFLPGCVGHSFAIVPHSEAKEGFIDVDDDDFKDEEKYFAKFQRNVIRLREDQWH